jgi:glycosyltransferase involved in cell wall biosynthesis
LAGKIEKTTHRKQRFLLVGSFALSMLKFRRDLLEAILVKGFEVHVSLPVPDEDTWIVEEFRSMGVIVHESSLVRTGTNPVHDLHSLFEYWRLMRRIRPSHVLSYTIKPIVYGSIAAWLARAPNRFALVTGRGYAFEGDTRKLHVGNIALWMYKVSLKHVDSVMFQNQDDEALFKDRGLVSPGCRTAVMNGSGVNLDDFPVVPLPERISFLLIARLLGAKGIREYVAAAKMLRNSGSEALFRVVGWIDDNPDSVNESELAEWKAEGIVEFLGRLNDVKHAISASSVYVLPSYREGTPRTVLEAMSMGRPIITTDAPGCREPVQNGENGFLVRVGSVDELADAMRRFIDEPVLVEQMGRRSRQIAEERYDVHKVNIAMLKEMGIENISPPTRCLPRRS